MEAVSRKRCASEPAIRRSVKRYKVCDEEECGSMRRVRALEVHVSQLTAIVQQFFPVLSEVSPSSTESKVRISCPVNSCKLDFQRIDHLNRHIRKIKDESHRECAIILDQTYCKRCKKHFSPPSNLVRHEKTFHQDKYLSRAHKFVSREDIREIASNLLADLSTSYELEQENVESCHDVMKSNVTARNISQSGNFPAYASNTPNDFQDLSNNNSNSNSLSGSDSSVSAIHLGNHNIGTWDNSYIPPPFDMGPWDDSFRDGSYIPPPFDMGPWDESPPDMVPWDGQLVPPHFDNGLWG